MGEHAVSLRCRAQRILGGGGFRCRGTIRRLGPAAVNGHELGDHYPRPRSLAVTERVPSPETLAELYDVLNPWWRADDFYLDLVMAARSVLDVGCGTGRLLYRAREGGHTGRLCGLDPDAGMLSLPQRWTDIEWVLTDAASAKWDREFDLAVMSHAFQYLVTDDDLRASLAAIRSALV